MILIFAFLVRVAGIGYGLPLWLIADEPPFTLGALKMIELKTVFPRFHAEEFNSVLYYPPYISYILLPAFSGILAFKYLTFGRDKGSFANYIGSDLSSFFIAARFINMIFALASIYLVYKIAKNIFKDEWVGLAAAFFTSTSLLHIMLSIAARQWMTVSFIFLLVLYSLIHPSLSFRKRYFFSVLISGIGMGASVISSAALFLVGFYFLFFEKKKLSELLREKFLYILGIIFVFLALLPLAIYPSSIGFGGKISFFGDKSFYGFISSPAKFLAPLLYAEPVLMAFFVAGLIFTIYKKNKLFWLFSLFIAVYSSIFYFFFRFDDRFMLPLVPLVAIIAGFGAKEFFNLLQSKNRYIAGAYLVILMFAMATFATRLAYLTYRNDSRKNMRIWVEANLKEGSKIIVHARLMRLAANAEAIREKQIIAPESLRQVDRSELFFGKSPIYPSFQALNISDLDKPILKEGYEFAVLSENDEIGTVLEGKKPIITFGEDSRFSITDSHLGKGPFELFETNELGPSVSLYKLK